METAWNPVGKSLEAPDKVQGLRNKVFANTGLVTILIAEKHGLDIVGIVPFKPSLGVPDAKSPKQHRNL